MEKNNIDGIHDLTLIRMNKEWLVLRKPMTSLLGIFNPNERTKTIRYIRI